MMTDPASPPDPELPKLEPSAPPVPGRRWVQVALAVSVGLNLAVAGLAIGAWIKDGPGRGMPRDLSFGPFTEALSDGDRHALRDALGEKGQGFRAEREAMRGELAALLVTLRATPFDPAAAEAALSAITRRAADRLDLGRELIEARILAMSDAERMAFADRLERGLKRH
jgi:uncharacterized membrane protein